MIIEIRKAGFVNKGSELMLLAILERLRDAYPDAIFTMAPTPQRGSHPYRKLVDAGLYPKAWLDYRGMQWGHWARFVPRGVREMYGIILDRDVDVVIDTAGFAYSDAWGPESTKELAKSAKNWHRQGTKVILMPQALGPYTSRRIRRAIRHAVECIQLVMPRDQTSLNYLIEVTGERQNIRPYPDFTILVEGIVPEYFNRSEHGVCLIPNNRMVDMTDRVNGSAYLPFMIHCARQLLDKKSNPFILVHEGKTDRELAEKISEGVGGLPVLVEHDPLKIKGILGASLATIGSRFHGLVSALSQGVPSLGTGWTHKYVELFCDYRFSEGLVSVRETESEIARKIDLLVDERSNRAISISLKRESARLRNRSEAMWEEIFSLIND